MYRHDVDKAAYRPKPAESSGIEALTVCETEMMILLYALSTEKDGCREIVVEGAANKL